VTHALAGARTPEQARENARAGELDLSPADLAEIAAAATS
jgi:aryl-alcohol dehydrogenase-like predicted oxidoreductase